MTELILWIEGPHGPINHAKFEQVSDLYDYVDTVSFEPETLMWNLDFAGIWYRNREREEGDLLGINSDCFFLCKQEEVPPEIRAYALLLS